MSPTPAGRLALLFWIAAIVVPSFGLYRSGLGEADWGLLLFLNGLLLAYSATRLSILIGAKQPAIATGVVWLFLYVTAAVVPLAQHQTGINPNLLSREYLVPAQSLVLVAAVSLDIGRYLARRGTSPRMKLGPLQRVLSTKRLKLVTAAAVPLTGYYVQTLGGLGAFFASRQERALAFGEAGLAAGGGQAVRGFITAFGTIPALIGFMAWTVLILRRRRNRQPIFFGQVMAWGLLLALNVIVNNPITNSRFWFLTVVFGLLFVAPSLSARTYRRTLIAGVVGAVIVFPYTDYFRRGPQQRQLVFEDIATKISSKDFDQSIMTANGIWYVAENGHTWGQQLLGVLLFWLPRSVWPSKPIDTGVMIGINIPGAGTTNLSSPMFLEFWIDFGWVGVAILMTAVGWLITRLDVRFAESLDGTRSDVLLIDLLLPLLAGYMFILMRGPLLQTMGLLTVLVLVCWFVAPSTGSVSTSLSASAKPEDADP